MDKEGYYVKCENCGKIIYKTPYQYKIHKHHFCDNKCSAEYRTKQSKIVKTCKFCGKDFLDKKSSPKLFCSVECQINWQKGKVWRNTPDKIKTKCDYCGNDIEVIPSIYERYQHHFCSKNCKLLWYSNVFSQSKEWKDESRKRAVRILSENKIPTAYTKPHIKICNLLNELNINYETERPFDYYSMDIFLTDYNLPIEIMGDFWHSNPNLYISKDDIKYQFQKDRIIHDKFKHDYVNCFYNKQILYLWETDINKDLELCKLLILLFIKNNGILKNYNSFNYHVGKDGLININRRIISSYQEIA